MAKHRKCHRNTINEDDLAEMDKLLLEFHECYQATIAPHLACLGNYIKYHKMAHFTAMIKRLGQSKHFNAQFFEAAHGFLKQIYRGTSKRRKTVIKEMVSVWAGFREVWGLAGSSCEWIECQGAWVMLG